MMVEVVSVNDQFVTLASKKGSYAEWDIAAIYALPISRYCKELWCYLKNINEHLKIPWLILGNFNQILVDKDKLGGSGIWRRSGGSLWNLLEDCDFPDVNYSGPTHTWTNSRGGKENIIERLDRAICNRAWDLKFTNGILDHLPRTHSDHCPLFVENEGL